MLKFLKILIAEDEEVAKEELKELLEMLCDNVYSASNGKEALELYHEVSPDIIILDIEMPFFNGVEVATEIRKNDKTAQIIITTAYTETKYLLKATELNLIKYLVKPVRLNSIKEALNIAVENISSYKKEVYKLGEGYTYNIVRRVLSKYESEAVHLSNNELLLLELLIKNINHTVSYNQIEECLYEYGYSDTSTEALRSLVKNLRKKLPENCLKNISKLGYKIEEEQ